MIYKFILLYCVLMFCLTNCGGGDGQYYPPEVVIDNIGIIKEEIFDPQFDDKAKLILEVGLERKVENGKNIDNITYYYFNDFKFINKNFLLAIPIKNFISILDS